MDEIKKKKKGILRETFNSLFVALIIALLLRFFVVEAFRIPSGSMIPTLLVGDHIFVNKFVYGLRIPLTKIWIKKFGDPERGEVVVFISPVEEGKDFIKRVVGVPGDEIEVRGDQVFINGKAVNQELINDLENIPDFPDREDFQFAVEDLSGHKHIIQYDNTPTFPDQNIVVPVGHIFVMGDNRHHSADSRDWGFVPLENIKGRAMFVWLSLNYDKMGVRWRRFGHWVK